MTEYKSNLTLRKFVCIEDQAHICIQLFVVRQSRKNGHIIAIPFQEKYSKYHILNFAKVQRVS